MILIGNSKVFNGSLSFLACEGRFQPIFGRFQLTFTPPFYRAPIEEIGVCIAFLRGNRGLYSVSKRKSGSV